MFRPGFRGWTEVWFAQHRARQAINTVIGEEPEQIPVIFHVHTVRQITHCVANDALFIESRDEVGNNFRVGGITNIEDLQSRIVEIERQNSIAWRARLSVVAGTLWPKTAAALAEI